MTIVSKLKSSELNFKENEKEREPAKEKPHENEKNYSLLKVNSIDFIWIELWGIAAVDFRVMWFCAYVIGVFMSSECAWLFSSVFCVAFAHTKKIEKRKRIK